MRLLTSALLALGLIFLLGSMGLVILPESLFGWTNPSSVLLAASACLFGAEFAATILYSIFFFLSSIWIGVKTESPEAIIVFQGIVFIFYAPLMMTLIFWALTSWGVLALVMTPMTFVIIGVYVLISIIAFELHLFWAMIFHLS